MKNEFRSNGNWPSRDGMIQGKQNVINLERKKYYFRLCIWNQFVKALNRDGNCFGISTEKQKAGIFDGPQTRQLKDLQFITSMNEAES